MQTPLKHAFLTIAAVFLAFAALDDITTDTDTSFVFERLMLVVCAAWFATLVMALRKQHRPVLAALSCGILLAAAVAQPWVGTKVVPGHWPAYLASFAGLVWFTVVAGLFALDAWRARPQHHLT